MAVTLEFRVDDDVKMAPGAWPRDTTNGVGFLVQGVVGDDCIGSSWGGPTRTMEVYLTVSDDMAGGYRDRLQAVLDAGTVTPPGVDKPTVVIQGKQTNSSARPACFCGQDDNSDW
jgi:hypothetical protein